MIAERDTSQDASSPGRDLVPSDHAPSAVSKEAPPLAAPFSGPSTRVERMAYAISRFGLQGIYIMSVATLAVLPAVFVPSCSLLAWPALKTVLILDVAAYLFLVSGLLIVIGRPVQSAPDGA